MENFQYVNHLVEISQIFQIQFHLRLEDPFWFLPVLSPVDRQSNFNEKINHNTENFTQMPKGVYVIVLMAHFFLRLSPEYVFSYGMSILVSHCIRQHAMHSRINKTKP